MESLVSQSQRPDAEPLLRVEGLHVQFPTARGTVDAVNGVAFHIRAGERVAVVGESGSGKSITAMSVMGLVPPNGMVNGSIRLNGREMIGLGERALVDIRGREIGLILQDATAALNPLRTIGSQIEEALRLHKSMSRKQARARALELIRQVKIGDPEVRARQYGHELSGGMAQRATIAAAVGPEPSLLIADEPTSALDATTAYGVLDLITELSAHRGMAVMLITHDLGVVARVAERVIVMYAGRVVEEGPVDEIFAHPRHPYTRGLLESVPGARGRRSVKAIPGTVPDPTAPPPGCVFHPRCSLSAGRERCRLEAPVLEPKAGAATQCSACHFAEELEPMTDTAPADVGVPAGRIAKDDLLVVDGLSKDFKLNAQPFRKSGLVHAVDSASFTVRRGEVMALVGESGSGKSTTGRMILGLESPSAGRVIFGGEDIAGRSRKRELQRGLQVVFQNPGSSLDPRMKVEDIIAEPLNVHRLGSPADRRRRVEELLEQVGLSRDHVGRYPFEFSGGQRQRIAIARALAPRPELIICDEPVTALDVSVQAQILNLLQEVQRTDGLSYLFVAHDLAVVRQIADRVAVMYLGHIVEMAEAAEFFAGPHHPYSVALLSAMPGCDPETERRRRPIVLSGAMPSVLDPPSGCAFHTRCWKAQSICGEVAPEGRELAPGRWAACHFPEGLAGQEASESPAPRTPVPVPVRQRN
jgi:peptide/nickel transport system ATP-binding protein